ncbi:MULTISPECIES: CvfD/Ygs/GSP13 family RNA-binding post-transcriptional regulator [unclassified Lactococcus]|uniref:CvfD/Ygs/GSP13 family RNA-binding post-transcriptional regulator n=1 Tax=unclassified Lactococcus TaxID=2643510 RepID=UPI0011CC3E5D|nr:MULTISPECIES: CvfD/Ygs/GSP13 family RNA-binding post-transcriptional regulator [unclassified Lactococcus]MQW22259.1 S1 RNA-binding domain-containing protein [Lactococcus sp. dk101]TXK45189.1 S1 RNA-binding domain-containing protein [Lactococcus sp. dk310]TXK51033.1 S1 RNA-binding domain-containing protein [Lactococcus sp. dk322]
MKTEQKIGDVVEVEVIGVQDYGAFVKFFPKNDKTAEELKGLIHISEIQSGYISNIREIIRIGQKLQAQIIDIDEYNGKISLSVRSLEKNPQVHHFYHKKHFTDARNKIGFESLSRELDHWVEENEAYLASQQAEGLKM